MPGKSTGRTGSFATPLMTVLLAHRAITRVGGLNSTCTITQTGADRWGGGVVARCAPALRIDPPAVLLFPD
jgi:hypothetical protein